MLVSAINLHAKIAEQIPTIAEVKAMSNSTHTKVSGVVTYIQERNVFIQDHTGGLLLFMSKTPTFTIGQQVIVDGYTSVSGGAPQLKIATEVSAEEGVLPEPIVFENLTSLVDDTELQYFGQLVKVAGLIISEYNSYNYPIVSDGIHSVQCYKTIIDADQFPIGTEITLTAVASYNNGFQFQANATGFEIENPSTPPCEIVYSDCSATDCDSYEWNGQTYTQSGEYTYTTIAANGCDSIVTLHLTINYSEVGETEYVTINSGETYTWNGQAYSTEGEYSITLSNTHGCDSVATLHLTVEELEEASRTEEAICYGDSYLWDVDGEWYDEAGTYYAYDEEGQHVLVLTVYPPTEDTEESATITKGSTYWWNDMEYTEAGTYTETLIDENGCEYTATLHLTVEEPEEVSRTEEAICYGEFYVWDINGEWYDESGTYYAYDEDGKHVLVLTVYPPTEDTEEYATIEIGDTYWWNDMEYTETGTYTEILTDENGCDYIATLHLTVEDPEEANRTEEAICYGDSYLWDVDGEWYDEAGTYYAYDEEGQHVLVLTVYPLTEDTEESATITKGSTYWWNDMEYTEAGTYTETLIDENGCEYTATLYLTVETSTKCGENLYWTFADGVLSISGEGYMYNYDDAYSTPWWGLPIESVVLQEGIKSIGDYAFSEAYSLAEVDIPDGLEVIGSSAFENCESLSYIVLPSSMNTIHNFTFYMCENLDTVRVEATVPPSIGIEVFTSYPICSIPFHTTSVYEESDWKEYVGGFVEEPAQSLRTACSEAEVIDVFTPVVVEGVTDAWYQLDVSSLHHNKQNVEFIVKQSGLTNVSCDIYLYKDCELTEVLAHIAHYRVDSVSRTLSYESFVDGDDARYMHVVTEGDFTITFEPINTELQCGDSLYWSFQDKVLSIYGTGDMYDFSDAPWSTIQSQIESVVIQGARTITSYAFEHCTNLQSISIPQTVEVIETGILYDCPSLVSIIIEEGNAYYDSRDNCNAIIETATNKLICGCQNTTIPNSVNIIGEYAFRYVATLKTIFIPKSVVAIEQRAFWDCDALTSIYISNGVLTIGDDAFADCDALQYLVIPESVKSIAGNIVEECDSLISLVVKKGNKRYDSRYNCNAIIDSKTNTLIAGCSATYIHDDVEIIGDYAFAECSTLENITLPNSIKRIGEYAFHACSNLYNMEIPSSVMSIGTSAFSGCTSLSSVELLCTTPPMLGENAFSSSVDCTIPCNTYDIYAASGWIEQVGSLNEDCPTQLDCEELEIRYMYVSGWNDQLHPRDDWYALGFNEYVEKGIECRLIINNSSNEPANVSLQGFHSCTATQSVFSYENTLEPHSSDVITFNPALFDVCYLHAVSSADVLLEWQPAKCGENLYWDFQDGVLSITGSGDMDDYFLFVLPPWANVDNITSVSLPEGLTSIGMFAFGYTNITTIDIPTTVKKIATYAFAYSALESLTIPAGVHDIGGGSFLHCPNLASIVVEDGNLVYDSRDNCNAIIHIETDSLILGCKNTTIPESVVSIGSYAFYLIEDSVAPLNLFTIPKSVISIAEGAFAESMIDTMYIESFTPPTIGKNAFTYASTYSVPCGTATTYRASDWGMYMADVIEYVPFDLITQVNDTSMGTVTVLQNPSCDQEVMIQAYPKDKHKFLYWHDGNTENPRRLSINSDTLMLAVFESIIYPNMCGDDLLWYYSNDTLSITGSGAMYDDPDMLSYREEPWYPERVKNIVLPNTITHIGNVAFADCENLTAIDIPSSVTSIGDGAFSWTGLQSVTIPASVTDLGEQVFEACNSLSTILYESEPLSINNQTIHPLIGCVHLDSIIVPAALWHCTTADPALEARYGVPHQARYIEVTDGELTFQAMTYIANNRNAVEVLDLTAATNTTLPMGALLNSHNLSTLYLPQQIELVPEMLAEGCSNLMEIIIPASVKEIGDKAFSGCVNVWRMTIDAVIPPKVYENTFDGISRSISVQVPAGSEDLYREAAYWREFFIGHTNNPSPISNCQKLLRKDQILILRNGKVYTTMGQLITNE